MSYCRGCASNAHLEERAKDDRARLKREADDGCMPVVYKREERGVRLDERQRIALRCPRNCGQHDRTSGRLRVVKVHEERSCVPRQCARRAAC